MTREELLEQMKEAYWASGPRLTDSLAAALDVAREELLRPIEYEVVGGIGSSAINQLLSVRSARYAREKTIEERVTIDHYDPHGKFSHVLLDGVHCVRLTRQDAEIYRLGLIAQLNNTKGTK